MGKLLIFLNHPELHPSATLMNTVPTLTGGMSDLSRAPTLLATQICKGMGRDESPFFQAHGAEATILLQDSNPNSAQVMYDISPLYLNLVTSRWVFN